MKVSFTGTQHGLTLVQRQALQRYLAGLAIEEFHHGDCIGADATAHIFVRAMRSPRVIIHPSNKKDKRAFCTGAFSVRPPKPPLVRNVDIVVGGKDELIACPKTDYEEQRSGTWTTVRRARERNIPVTVVWPDGRVEPDNAQ